MKRVLAKNRRGTDLPVPLPQLPTRAAPRRPQQSPEKAPGHWWGCHSRAGLPPVPGMVPSHTPAGAAALTQRPLEQPPYWSLLSAEAPPTPPQSLPHTAFSPTHTVKYFWKGVSIVPQEPSGLLPVSRCLALTPRMALTSPLIQALHFIVRQSET